MSKRKAGAHSAVSVSKRYKPNGITAEVAPPETIKSARQLKSLLEFRQDSTEEIKYGVRVFKVFLESIVYAQPDISTTAQQKILQEYLESQVSTSTNDEGNVDASALPGLIQSWSFASDTNTGTLLSSIPAVLALLLRTMSNLIAFRELGLQVCRMLLQVPQLKLIQKGLNAQKEREHIISPCLRLLTEMVSYDGGTLAGNVFAAKEYIFSDANVVRNLRLRKDQSQGSEDLKRGPAVRTNTVRYVLACIRYLSAADKIELFKYTRVMFELFDHIKSDPPQLSLDFVKTMEAQVLRDKNLPRVVKHNLFTDHCLASLALITEPKSDVENTEIDSMLRTTASDFLQFICSSPDAGILHRSQGWYPPGTESEHIQEESFAAQTGLDLGLDSRINHDTFKTNVPIRNVTLSKFAQRLRPHVRAADANLVLQIFRSAPEVVADYFFKKSNFSFDPNLTMTWIGYSSFLYSVVQLSVPTYFGRLEGYGRVPPPTSIVMENLLPLPLTQKALTRCLNQPVELITFFAIRILCVALKKLQVTLDKFKEAAKLGGNSWNESALTLRKEYMSRTPTLKDVITAVRQTSSSNLLQKEAALRLISLYYDTFPELVLDEKFAVAIPLVEAVSILESPQESDQSTDEKTKQGLQLLQLGHLVHIASQTPDMKWWNKPDTMALTPFVMLLKIAATMPFEIVPAAVYSLIDSVMRETAVLQQETKTSASHSLIASLRMVQDNSGLDALYAFINEVLTRIVRQPIKYEDELDELADDLNHTGPVSLLTVALAEQWPFAVKRSSASDLIALWLSHYLRGCEAIDEDNRVLNRVRERLLSDVDTENQRTALKSSYVENISPEWMQLVKRVENTQHRLEETEVSVREVPEEPELSLSSLAPPSEDLKYRGLHRWSNKDTVSAVLEGDLASLILCLSSTHADVQKLALGNLRQFMRNLEAPQLKTTYPEATQISLLLGLLINTVTPMVTNPTSTTMTNGVDLSSPPPHDEENTETPRVPTVPYLCTVYAVMALQILQDPMHPLYEKFNTFHTRSPKWDVDRLPSYWTHQILFTPPTPSRSTHSSKPSRSSQHTNSEAPSTYDIISDSTKRPQPIPRSPHAFLLSYIHASLRQPDDKPTNKPEYGLHENHEHATHPGSDTLSSQSADLHILQARSTLEPLLALANTPSFPLSLFALLLRILWRVTFLRGGSTMLITRKGIVSVLHAWIAKRAEAAAAVTGTTVSTSAAYSDDVVGEGRRGLKEDRTLASVWGLKRLLGRIWESCDREYVERWSGGNTGRVVLQIMAEE